MATETFSFEEASGADFPTLVPAKRTTLQDVTNPEEVISSMGDAIDPKKIQNLFTNIAGKHKATITSMVRPIINKGAGARSQHPHGTAADFRTKDKTPEEVEALMNDLRSAGFEVIDERNGSEPHIHAELPGKRRRTTMRQEQQEAKKETFSFEEAMPTQRQAPKVPPVETAESMDVSNEEGIFGEVARVYKDKFSPAALATQATQSLKKGWEGLQEVLNSNTIEVELSDADLRAEWEQKKKEENTFMGIRVPDFETYKRQQRFLGPRRVDANAFADEELQWKQRIQENPEAAKNLPKRFEHLKPATDVKGFLANLENPAKLLLEDSLPAEFVSALANGTEFDRKAFDEARRVAQQENIVANPDKFPRVSVEAAQREIDKRRANKDPGILAAWDDLKRAAKEDPGRFAAALTNSLMSDPYMLAAPVGIGIKPVQAAQAARGVTVASRAAKLADRIIDAGSTAAGVNVAIGAVENLANKGKINVDEVKMNAALGYAIGGPVGALFLRSARAKAIGVEGAKASGKLDEILKDAAKADIELEEIVTGTSPKIDRSVRNRIDQLLGIRTEAERKAWLDAWRKQTKSAYESDPETRKYFEFIAEERVTRRAEILEAEKASAARKAAEAEAREAADRRARLNEDFDRAVMARDAAEVDDLHAQALAENQVWETARKANNEEVLDALYTKDNNTIKQAMEKARRRDAHLRRPKHARGEVDPKLLARVGAVGAGATLAYAASPEELKMQNSILGGLAGLALPGGGRVLSRMKQAGAISPEGDIVSLLVRQGKIVDKLDAEQIKVRDNALVDRIAAGDQKGMREAYDAYYKPVTRYVEKFLREAGPKLGIDAEDVAQETFLKVFQNIGDYSKDYPLEAWIKRIARNQALDVIERSGASKRSALTRVDEEIPGARDSYSGDQGSGSNVYERGAGSDTFDTPELQAVRQQSEEQLIKAFNKMPEDIRQAIVMSQLENYTDVQIAEMTNTPLGTVQRRIQRGKEMLTNSIKEEIRVPKGQRGEVSPEDLKKVLKTAGVASAGGAIAAYLNDDSLEEIFSGEAKKSTYLSMVMSAAAALVLKGRIGAEVVKHVDYAFGASSTRVMKHSPKIHRATVNLFRKNLEDIHSYFQQVDPFISRLDELPKDVQNAVARAVMTGDGGVTAKFLDYLGDSVLKNGYKDLRRVLDSLGDQLQDLNRFKKGVKEYFPRVVIDKEGLFQAIGKKEASDIANILKEANVESMRKQGRPLNQVEESALINQVLFVDKRANQPSWSKNRGVDEITPELLKFYASPAESLHTYIRSAVEDLNKAKFFGKFAKNTKKGNQEFLDVDRSINNLIADEVKAGTLTDEGAREVSDVLKSLFAGGEKAPAFIIQEAKNLSNAGLLGNFWSAATQMGDVVMQTYLQGFRPTLESIARQLTGKKFVDMRDFGLLDSITAEFATQSKSAKYVNRVFKFSLFSGIDRFGKNTALNAAIARAKMQMASESGQLRFANKYAPSFGSDLPKLMGELKSGKFSDLTREWAFMELSRSQPVTKFEMSQWWLDSPNIGRSALTLKSFMMKQIDLVRRDGVGLMAEGYKTGNKAKIAQGAMKLTQLGIVMGLAGTASDVIKQFMHQGWASITGREPEPLNVDIMSIPTNALKTFGWSEYVKDRFMGVSRQDAAERRAEGDKMARARKAEPVKTTVEYFTPPYEMFTDLVTGDPNSYRYLIPLVGPAVARMAKEADKEEREEEKRREKEEGL